MLSREAFWLTPKPTLNQTANLSSELNFVIHDSLLTLKLVQDIHQQFLITTTCTKVLKKLLVSPQPKSRFEEAFLSKGFASEEDVLYDDFPLLEEGIFTDGVAFILLQVFELDRGFFLV